ncbi:uncharacterized protein [Chanodichthys erythropterus]|uniref:uncharacterized protein n=1 Tax=Chanodichthys erythropterus TaxID=933992 RepID=UPI00351E5292
MGIFLIPVPPKPLKADERLCLLRQSGRPLERYVEEFLEVSYLVSWTDACLNAVFLMGLDKDVICYNEPACNFSLVNSLNIILLLNGSNFEADKIQKNQSPCPAPSAAYRALPAHLTPEPCTYRFNGPAYSWPLASAKPSATASAAEPDAPAAEPAAPVSTEPAPVLVGILLIYEAMDRTPFHAAEPSAPAAAAEPSAPVSAADEPASPVSAADEPASPVSAADEPASPVSAADEPASPVAGTREEPGTEEAPGTGEEPGTEEAPGTGEEAGTGEAAGTG